MEFIFEYPSHTTGIEFKVFLFEVVIQLHYELHGECIQNDVSSIFGDEDEP